MTLAAREDLEASLLRDESNPHSQSGVDLDSYLTAAKPDCKLPVRRPAEVIR
jgi:hypothetical protein